MLLQRIKNQRAWALVELGMSAAEFNNLTPAEFVDYLEAWKQKQAREEYRLGRLCYTIARSMGAKNEDGTDVKMSDFIVDITKKKRSPRRKKFTADQLLSQFMQATKHIPQDGN